MSFRFRDWPVYKDARSFRQEVLQDIVSRLPKDERYELVSQLKRALNSVVLNIAEGSYRKSDKDFAHFLNQSMTSLYEVVACIDLANDDCYIDNQLLNEYIDRAEKVARQISAFSSYLNRSN